MARTHTRTAINVLVGIMRSKDATAAARVTAANAILDRSWGKAAQPLQNGDDEALELIHRIERVIDHTAESIKSLEGFRIAWIDEAQTLSVRSLSLLPPTIRAEASELWASWNPRRKSDAIDAFFRERTPPGAVVVQANRRDNPLVSGRARRRAQARPGAVPGALRPHIRRRLRACLRGRLLRAVAAGCKGARADRKSLRRSVIAAACLHRYWRRRCCSGCFHHLDRAVVGNEIRVLDYSEAVGQVLSFHVNWLRANGYAQAILYLPHDGVATNNITGKRYEDHLREAGFTVEPPVKNQGSGAAMMRIEALRRLGPQLWFNEASTEPGRDALGFHHERKDDNRNVGLGPEHDWSSHAADALGLMAICYEQPCRTGSFNQLIRYAEQGWV
jgi:phage terminase large subunit